MSKKAITRKNVCNILYKKCLNNPKIYKKFFEKKVEDEVYEPNYFLDDEEVDKNVLSKKILTEEDIREIFEKIIEQIGDCLKSGDKLEFRNFGVFEVLNGKTRIGRNLKTNEPITIPPKKTVAFKPGKLLKEIIQNGE